MAGQLAWETAIATEQDRLTADPDSVRVADQALLSLAATGELTTREIALQKELVAALHDISWSEPELRELRERFSPARTAA